MRLVGLFILTLIAQISFGQELDWTKVTHPNRVEVDYAVENDYSFINLSANSFQFATERSPLFEQFYRRLMEIKLNGKGKLNIYHIGGSHIQADMYSNVVREKLSRYVESDGERGLIFPHNLANSNNPSNYRITSNGRFESQRIVGSADRNLDLGLFGVGMAGIVDTSIQMQFKYRTATHQPCFDEVAFLRNKGEWPFEMNFGEDEILVETIEQNDSLGWTKVKFCDPLDSLDVQFNAKIARSRMEFYGIGLFNSYEAGISYTSIGVNGAGLYSYLAAPNFEEQLKLYPPDFFIFSVGTNDANVPYDKFSPQKYKDNLEKMMKIVWRANPNCAILLTVPNDAYYRKKNLNRNIAREREVIWQLCQQYELPMWDFYGVMGELGSSKTWMTHGLMQSDLVHFTAKGYQLKGNLLMDAFLKYFKQFENLLK